MSELTAPARCKTLEEACAYLEGRGYQCSVYKLSRDHGRRGRINRDQEGWFTHAALDSYGRAHCKLLGGNETMDAKMARLAREKTEGEARQAIAQAARRELQLARERGQVVDRVAVEKELAARAVQLRGDFESWAYEVPLRITDRYNLGADAIAEIRRLLLDAGREWFNRYTDAREFVTYVPAGAQGEGDG